MKKEILCTLGPSSLNERVIVRLEELGVSLFRINLSHTTLKEMPKVINKIRSYASVPICLDTEGAQIRTGTFVEGGKIYLRENSVVSIPSHLVPGNSQEFNLYPISVVKDFRISDLISIDFNSVLLQVIERKSESVIARVINGGWIRQNKAVNLDREFNMPPLTEKDRKALKIGMDMDVRYAALSFANRVEDVETFRKIMGEKVFIIAKIESRNGLKNLERIAKKSDAILFDRGDMSRQIPIERIPVLQKEIIRRIKQLGTKIFVATNLLESMVSESSPTRAEVNDVFNTLKDGADGLVLAAETAVGSYPIECASMIVKLIRVFEERGKTENENYPTDTFSLLVEPHGGRLVQRMYQSSNNIDPDCQKHLKVRDTDLFDCEHIALGGYSPITGFMGKKVLESVLNKNKLPDGTVWTLPIVLQVCKEDIKGMSPGDRIALVGSAGKIHSLMDISEMYNIEFDDVASKWFGTTSRSHPGVARLEQNGDWFLGGEITLVERLSNTYHHYELAPAQTRLIFSLKGWNKVVGFHSRNVIHRVHEHIQKTALEKSHADGIYISPVIGPKKKGDFLPEPIMKSYQIMMDFGLFPKGRVVVGSFLTYSRYSGPREAVFTALRHKNMGCSHFIIGRDHTGVGDLYKSIDYRKYFEDLGDIGIQPIFFDAIGYNPRDDRYESITNEGTIEPISGTQVREALKINQPIPDWFMRDIIQEMLQKELRLGRAIFVE